MFVTYKVYCLLLRDDQIKPGTCDNLNVSMAVVGTIEYLPIKSKIGELCLGSR